MYIEQWLGNPNYTELVQIVTRFTIGVIMGSLSWGIIWILASIILVEIMTWEVLRKTGRWHPFFRLSLNCAYLTGWELGRLLVTDDDAPQLCRLD